jgi:predicted house-cleaning noncanonical NTP pyrophosphatase (MazG superfamily)
MSGKVFYNKLIRDGIETKILSKGDELEVRTLSDDQEFEQELLKKIAEESSALSRVRSKEEFLDEYADLMAVLDELKKLLGVTDAEVEKARAENTARKGGFLKRLFLRWSSDTGYKSNETPQGINS